MFLGIFLLYDFWIKVADFLSNPPLFSSFLPVFPRARTRQEFSCFLPSPLHLSGVNGWSIGSYGWRSLCFESVLKFDVNNWLANRYGWRFHPPWYSPFPSPDEGAHERSWFLCGMVMEEVKPGWRKNERWSLHSYLFVVQCVWLVCCEILRRVAFTLHLLVL